MTEPFSNHLAGETSPYLLQHLHNPVDWYPWNEPALQKAKAENKLLIVSIGYAACHWCHVMEHESFEDTGVAELMNADFVSIKVDREERPDVDQVYMFAAYAVAGRGGWPLNIIALPDGRPVYAGTYFPKRDWLYLLKKLAENYRENPSDLILQAENIHRKMQQMEGKPSRKSEIDRDMKIPDRLFDQLKSRLDHENGGSIGAPKFPMPCLLDFILQYETLSAGKSMDQKAKRSFVALTLLKMASGGIFDHLGGGFCRYSTDDHWHIPHFEKMLYDNAQLVSLYSKSFSLFGDPLLKEVVYSTLGFVERELTSAEGLFYSSIDADSEGKEGAYYAWKVSEVEDLLKPDHLAFMEHFHITAEGNWEEGENVLWNPEGKEPNALIPTQKEILFRARETRIHPALDNKILSSWNALMIIAYVDAYKAFSDDSFLRIALKAAEEFTGEIMNNSGKLQRMANSERPSPAFLDDYAFMIKACTDLYQVTFNTKWLKTAEQLISYTITHFHDPESGLFYFTSDEDPALIDRRMEFSDNVIPSSNAVMADQLFILGHLLAMGKWISLSESMLRRMIPKVYTDPSFYAHWASLYLKMIIKPFEVSIVGKEWKKLLQFFHQHYLPFVLFSGGEIEGELDILKYKGVEGKTLIYVCRDKTCTEPFDSAEGALEYIQKNT